MFASVVCTAALLLVAALAAPHKFVSGTDDTKPVYGAYVLLTRGRAPAQSVGLDELNLLVESADTIPINRLWISFFSPTMVYKEGSMTLVNTGMNLTSDDDLGFAKLKDGITKLQSAGVEVFLSMGGWNFNCFPYAYMQYSVGGYGVNTPNYWKIQQYGGGDKANCVESNQFCWVCEPPSENTTLADFSIFPLPENSPTWKQAVDYVTQGAKGVEPPQFHYELKPNHTWTDKNTSRTVTIPGSDLYDRLNRDPYQDFVYLAKDLGVAGVDLDYEEFWHADLFKDGADPGPYNLPQTVYKYNAIAKDIIINIQNIYPTLKLSTAAGAVGAWQSNWWGGNLKGVWSYSQQWYPENIAFMSTGANAGGIDVMTYDLSKNPEYHECPQDNVCALNQQVAFYMDAYQNATINAFVGYEIGTPAYPSPEHDLANQLPLTTDELALIMANTQPKFKGGFFWAIFKPSMGSDFVTTTQLAQTLCKKLDPSSSRCNGEFPSYPPAIKDM